VRKPKDAKQPGDRPPVPVIFRAAARPIQEFFELEAASGIVLLVAAAAALAWANLGGAAAYRALVDTPFALSAGPLSAAFTLREVVNDGLMTLFFFLVGMEIKEEMVLGELRTPRQASLPLVGALGGMFVPAATYVAFNRGGPGLAGWGVPMATDIAFTIGVLTLLRSRVPRALVVFVTALAIFDDIGGILVIAVFYGHGVHAVGLAAAAAVGAGLFLLSRRQVFAATPWALGGVLLWYAFHHAGIHATLAGVALGLAIPARPRIAPREVVEALARHAGALVAGRSGPDDELDWESIRGIERTLEATEAPLARFTSALHPWVAFGVMPVFAFANSGVEVGGLSPERLGGPVVVGTAVALFAGKQLGIFAFTATAVKLGLASVPGGAGWARLLGVSMVAGIGFTVALFIAGLAFADSPALLDEAKVGILAGSLAAGVAGALVLRATPPVHQDRG
jgi:NhaA family Na+:H+ antiporter